MSKVRVLVVDDSVVFRTQIQAALKREAWIEVLGAASNGRIALEKIKALKPDLITLDLEMPELNGVETLREMKRTNLVAKTIVFSALSKRGAQITLDALEAGALDFVTKPDGESAGNPNQNPADLLHALLVPKIKDLFPIAKSECPPVPDSGKRLDLKTWTPSAVVIGSSTGGPTALEKIFAAVPGPFCCPVLIAQHMPPIFTASLAQRLGKICGVPAAEAIHGEDVVPNRIYVAPGNYHMQVLVVGQGMKIQLNQQEPEHSVRPAVDQLFRSAAAAFHKKCLGIILTGMGRDGALGCEQLRAAQNRVVIQSRESCVVFGMPGAVFEAQAYDEIQDLEQIAATLRACLHEKQQPQRTAI